MAFWEAGETRSPTGDCAKVHEGFEYHVQHSLVFLTVTIFLRAVMGKAQPSIKPALRIGRIGQPSRPLQVY